MIPLSSENLLHQSKEHTIRDRTYLKGKDFCGQKFLRHRFSQKFSFTILTLNCEIKFHEIPRYNLNGEIKFRKIHSFLEVIFLKNNLQYANLIRSGKTIGRSIAPLNSPAMRSLYYRGNCQKRIWYKTDTFLGME